MSGPEVTTKKSKDRSGSWTTDGSTYVGETDTEDELIHSSVKNRVAREAKEGQQRDRSVFTKDDTNTQTDAKKGRQVAYKQKEQRRRRRRALGWDDEKRASGTDARVKD